MVFPYRPRALRAASLVAVLMSCGSPESALPPERIWACLSPSATQDDYLAVMAVVSVERDDGRGHDLRRGVVSEQMDPISLGVEYIVDGDALMRTTLVADLSELPMVETVLRSPGNHRAPCGGTAVHRFDPVE